MADANHIDRVARAGSRTPLARPSIANRTVFLYALIAIALLLPGLASRAPDAFSYAIGWPALSQPLSRLASHLEDIRFGSGLRFWLGVGGAVLIGLLLLYPLRKMASGRRLPGRVGTWFHVHILIGITAPVMVLYHANFGPGGVNANVALIAMLVLVASGFAGQFVYTRISADFYGRQRRAQELRADLLRVLPVATANSRARATFAEDLEALELALAATGAGLFANLRTRVNLETRGRQLAGEAQWIIAAAVSEQGVPREGEQRLR